MSRSQWPGAGLVRDGVEYCCDGCAYGTGCICEYPAASSSQREFNGRRQRKGVAGVEPLKFNQKGFHHGQTKSITKQTPR